MIYIPKPADWLTFTHNSYIVTVSALMHTSQEMMTLSDDALIPNASQFTEQDGATACTEPSRSMCSCCIDVAQLTTVDLQSIHTAVMNSWKTFDHKGFISHKT